jgi:hypothetical protein
MPSSTATIVQSKPKTNGTVSGNGKAKVASTPKDDENYEHFFWTYTEEPHRTRRMAIIKAHPEVWLVNWPVLFQSLTIYLGHQTLRSRTPNQVHRYLRRCPSNNMRLSIARHTILLMEVLPHGLHHWRNSKPELLPRDPRNQP